MNFKEFSRTPFGGLAGLYAPAGALVAAILLGLSPASFATEPQQEPRSKGKEVTSKGEERTPATAINFGKALELPFDSLISLGARIEIALKVADPVCLAGLAKELSVCEQVSGRTASLTSATLFKDAVAMVEARDTSMELRAVAQYVPSDETAKKLNKLAQIAEKREGAARQASASGERSKGINGSLIVHNNTGFFVLAFEDGRCLGPPIPPYANAAFYIGHGPNQNSVVFARSTDGAMTWGPNIIDFNPFDWHFNVN